MLKRSSWLILIFLGLIVLAIILVSQKSIDLLPSSTPSPLLVNGSSLPILADQMPPFSGITKWWNTTNGQALTPEMLKGKVVLIDFWTYSCINCIRTQPVLRQWWKTYEKDGLVIVGVHTPEFSFEKDPQNVSEAIRKAELTFPVALDPDYLTWNNYNNRYWPAEYFFDQQGRLRHVHFGEGSYDESEQAIRSLLAEGGSVTSPMTGVDSMPKFSSGQTAETYFGLTRTMNFKNSSELEQNTASEYHLKQVEVGEWSVNGKWKMGDESAQALSSNSVFRMRIKANAMHLVLGSLSGKKRMRVVVDSKDPSPDQRTSDIIIDDQGFALINIDQKRLYHIARFPDGGEHTIELLPVDVGVEFFAATFGE